MQLIDQKDFLHNNNIDHSCYLHYFFLTKINIDLKKSLKYELQVIFIILKYNES